MRAVIKTVTIIYAMVYPVIMLQEIPKGTIGLFGYMFITMSIYLWNRNGGIVSAVYASAVIVLHYMITGGSFSAVFTGLVIYFLLGIAGGWFTQTVRMKNRALASEIRSSAAIKEKLAANEMFLSNAMRLARLGPWTIDLEANTLSLSDEHMEMMGYRKGEIDQRMSPEHYIQRHVHPDDVHLVTNKYRHVLRNNGPDYTEELGYRMLKKDGSVLEVYIMYHGDREDRSKVYGTTQDVTAMRKTEKDLVGAFQQLQVLKNALDESFLVTITDTNGAILHVNDRFCEASGYSREQLLGKDHRILNSGHHPSDFFANMWRTIEEGNMWRDEILNRTKDGSLHWLDTTIVPLKDESGNQQQYVAIRKDITARKTAEEQIVHLAYHDSLTGLPNRLLLYERLGEVVASPQSGKQAALVLLDLDNFKMINDSLGHYMGDELLKSFTERLSRFTREDEVISRIGGDEFVVLIPHFASFEKLYARCKEMSESIKEPFQLGEHLFFVTASIGISLFPNHGSTVEELVKAADLAMYHAKGEGKDAFYFFQPEMNSRVTEMVSIERNLRKALQNNEFFLQYQPIIELETGGFYGVESLIRWNSPELGIVPPVKFISLAEDAGLSGEIFEWVLRTACHQYMSWERECGYSFIVNVNVSPRQFKKVGFAESVLRIIEETRIRPQCVNLEITEDGLLENPDENVNRLNVLKQAGVSISIDDFGTGFSSLHQLKTLPIDKLKIDRVFLKDVHKNDKDQALLQSIIALTHNLGLTAVAEGVETAEQLSLLKQIGCDYVQGFYISYPLDTERLTELLRLRQAHL
ncbi:EAL domain-containing protein [Paenibacillus sp. MBLB4367]|uniref:sensor domain-containing protein n=1 Tax=Paenibacillus sp. MBLB4367 TaxID=3384767 RepID=UPI003907F753